MALIISFLFLISFAGLTYVLMTAFFSGADEYANTYSHDTAREFEDVFLFIPPKRIIEIAWALSALAFIIVFMAVGNFRSALGFLSGLLLASIVAMICFHSPRSLLKILKQRRLSRFNLQLVDTLQGISNALKAGFSITQAFEAVVKDGDKPISQEFDVFLQQTRVGLSFSDAMENMDQRVGSDDLTLVISAIETARKTGGNLTEILEKISSTIRERMRIEGRIKTLTSQGRMQGIIAASMPVLIGLAMMAIEPEMMRPFLHSAMGAMVIAAVVILITLGWLIIRAIINIDV